MNADSLLENFHCITRAPSGVRRVRDLIYYFAITGGLSRAEIGDSDAKLILDDSLQAKRNYHDENSVRQGARKHSEIFQVVNEIPGHWAMVAAGDLMHLINGRAFKSTDWKKSGLPIIRIQNLNNPNAPFNFFQGEALDGHLVRTGDMLLSWSGTPGTSFGAFIWSGDDAVLNQHIFKVVIFSAKISKEYLKMAINASLDALIGSARGGVGLKHVTKGQIESLQIPLPPLEEQKRIVAKVDELMRLCDRLEAQQREQEKLLPLHSRANHIRFVAEPNVASLNLIFDQIGNVVTDDLRGTILQLAVMGRLVPRIDSEGDTESLIEKIVQKRRQQADNGGDRMLSPLTDVDLSSQLPEIPEHWQWIRLGNLTAKIGSGSTPRGGAKVYVSSGIPFLRSQNIWNDGIRLDDVAYITPETHQTMRNTHVLPNDILLNITGASLGRCAKVSSDFSTANVSQHVTIVRPLVSETRHFLHIFLLSPFGQGMIWDRQVGMAREGLSKKVLEQFEIPLPPLEEQLRIVQRVEQLLKLVDRLSEKKSTAAHTAKLFATSAVAAITSTEFTENERMKAPKTEVVTALKIGSKPKKSDLAPLATLLLKQKAEASAKSLWQLSGLEIDTFYRQLKTEMANGWIDEDKDKRTVHEVEAR